MNNKSTRASWIIHDKGSLKLSLAAETFYRSCLKRIGCENLPLTEYQPWMSSPVFAKIYLEKADYFTITKPQKVLDFDPAFLKGIDKILRCEPSLPILDSDLKLDIFQEIATNRKRSVEIYEKSLNLISEWEPWQSKAFFAIIKSIIPISSGGKNDEDGNAFSDHHMIGAIFTSVEYRSPFPEISLNISFAHELGHQALMLYQNSGDMFFGNDSWVYSGVRKTLRPVVASFHAAVALSYMIECIRSLLRNSTEPDKSAFLKVLLDEYRIGLESGINAIAELPKSDLCDLILNDLKLSLN